MLELHSCAAERIQRTVVIFGIGPPTDPTELKLAIVADHVVATL